MTLRDPPSFTISHRRAGRHPIPDTPAALSFPKINATTRQSLVSLGSNPTRDAEERSPHPGLVVLMAYGSLHGLLFLN